MARRSNRQSLQIAETTQSSQAVPRKRPRISSAASKQTGSTKTRHLASNLKVSRDDTSKEEDSVEDSDHAASVNIEEESNYGDDSDHESSDYFDRENESADEQPKRKRKPARDNPVKERGAAGKQGSELWRAGVTTGLPPGTQVIIKKPKARTAGKTPYTDSTIHPNTLLFLGDLKANNDREWFKSEPHPCCSVPKTHHLTPGKKRL